MTAFVNAMDAMPIRGENSASELPAKAVGSPLVALFFKLVRGIPASSLQELMASVPKDDPESLADLVVLAYQTRATRGMGKGEKAIFYQMIAALPVEAALATIHLLPHYGYFKDLCLLTEVEGMPSAVSDKAIELLANQLRKDGDELAAAEAAKRTPQLSLAGKYAPREGGHFDKGGGAAGSLAKRLAKLLFGAANGAGAARRYRQLVASLNRALNTTEVLMAAGRFAEIEFSRVASLCLQRQRKAFLNEALKGPKLTPAQEATGNRHPEDEDRVAARVHLREAMLAKGAKALNGKQLFPHEIAQKCMQGSYGGRRRATLSALEADLMHAQWEAMRGGVREAMAAAAASREVAVLAAAGAGAGLEAVASLRAALPKPIDLGKLVPLVDVSASMTGTPMEAAIGLGLVVAELTHPAFRDRAITFESRPAWVDLSGCDTIAAKVQRLQGAGWGGSTDFEAACELILAAAERAGLAPDEVPDLIVFSDMQFDQAHGGGRGGWETHHEKLTRRFAEVGRAVCGEPYAAPRIIYWNLRGDTAGFPVEANAPNTQMLSGFSPSLLKLVLSGKDLVGDEKEVKLADGTTTVVREGPTPEETVRAALDDAAFDPVRLALAGIKEGPLAGYTFERDGAVVVADKAPGTADAAADGFEMV